MGNESTKKLIRNKQVWGYYTEKPATLGDFLARKPRREERILCSPANELKKLIDSYTEKDIEDCPALYQLTLSYYHTMVGFWRCIEIAARFMERIADTNNKYRRILGVMSEMELVKKNDAKIKEFYPEDISELPWRRRFVNAGIKIGNFSQLSAFRLASSVLQWFIYDMEVGYDKCSMSKEEAMCSALFPEADLRLIDLFNEIESRLEHHSLSLSNYSETEGDFKLEGRIICWKILAEISEIRVEYYYGKQKKPKDLGMLTSLSYLNEITIESLNEKEKIIIETIGNEKMTGPIVAKKSGYPYDKDLRAKLSELVKRNILDNKRGQGYFLRPEYSHLFDDLK